MENFSNTTEAYAESLMYILSLRDLETAEHTRRVTDLTLSLAHLMNLPKKEIIHIRYGAMLHDIGKIGIPDSIFHKVAPLTRHEWDKVREHPVHAYELLSIIPDFRHSLEIPYYHHEKWDGSGYPCQLRGNQIPLAARMFAIVDVWDALLSNRPYRSAWSVDRTIEYIKCQAGKHFDPEIANIFLEKALVMQHHFKTMTGLLEQKACQGFLSS